MICTKCRHENRSSAKFCEECGTTTARQCAVCAGPLSASAKFCSECAHPVAAGSLGAGAAAVAGSTPAAPQGATFASSLPAWPERYTPSHLARKILTSRSAVEGERKQVTVLFADLKGSMELLAERDAESARQVLDPVLELMMEAVHRFEGTVNQVMGDGIMALFGAPLAHEDHAVRACYAALRMQEQAQAFAEKVRSSLGVPIRLRVGLNSGEVLVRAIGSDLQMDYTAVGQTTHLAARMEQLAEAGTVLLAPATLALADGFVKVRSLGPTAVKGLSAPVEVHELLGASDVRGRLQAAAARGLTRFVGRDTELERLHELLQRAGDGRGQVVAIVGEPGVGKSRLTWEFLHSRPCQPWLVLQCAAVSYGTTTTYAPVVELLRSYFGIEARDDARRSREKVIGKILALNRTLEASLPVFLSLLNIAVDDAEWTELVPLERKRRTLDALKRLFLLEGRLRPVLLVVEDTQWIDSESQAFLDLLVDGLSGARLLLLATHRTGWRHSWAAKSYFQQISLDTLAAANAEELLRALLGQDPSVAALRQRLIERTEGNPFFLEECVRALVDTGALHGSRGAYRFDGRTQALQLPATAQAMLAARIDRLPDEDKRLLQAAAVIGKDVPFVLLHAITDLDEDGFLQSLARLQGAEFLYESRLFPDIEYSFKHALSHEVAIAGLVSERRMGLHARTLASLERLFADRLGEHIERLARHAWRGQVWDKAALYGRQAGSKASGRSATADARQWFEQALAALQRLPETPQTLDDAFGVYLELRPVLVSLAEIRESLKRAQDARLIAARLGDEQRVCKVFATMTSSQALLGELDEALGSGQRALSMAEGLQDLRLTLLATSVLLQTHMYRGDYLQAVTLAERNLAQLPPAWAYEFLDNISPSSIFDRVLMTYSLAELGRFDEALTVQRVLMPIAEPTRHALSLGLASRSGAFIHLLRGEWQEAARPLLEWRRQLDAGGITLQMPAAAGALAWDLAHLGQFEQAQAALEEGERLARALTADGLQGFLGLAYFTMGRAAFALGHPEDARRFAQRVFDTSPQHLGYVAHAWQLLGDVALAAHDLDGGAQHYHKALALAEPRCIQPIVAHASRGMASLLALQAQAADALPWRERSARLYTEMGMDFYLEASMPAG